MSLRGRALAALGALCLAVVAPPAGAALADRYVIDVHRPDKAFPGTTIFGDHTDPNRAVIVEVDATGRVVWSYDVPASLGRDGGMDVEWVPAADTILFTRRDGAYEVDRRGRIVWRHEAPSSHDADRLPNGNTLVVWGWGDDSSDPELREVDRQGRVVWQWHADRHLAGEKRILQLDGYTHANSAVRLANGNTLVSLRNFHMLVEVAPAGQIVWKLGGLFSAPHDPEMLPNGNILVNTRGPQVIRELTPAGDTVWRHAPNQDEIQTVRYNHRLPNGNILFVERTKIVEITRDGDVVWQLRLTQVGTAQSDKPRWLYKAERIPAGRRAAPRHAYAAPSETLARLGGTVTTPEQQIAEQSRRAAAAMMARMDADGDGRIAKGEFAGRVGFGQVDADGDGFVTLAEAEAFHRARLLRQAAGELGPNAPRDPFSGGPGPRGWGGGGGRR